MAARAPRRPPRRPPPPRRRPPAPRRRARQGGHAGRRIAALLAIVLLAVGAVRAQRDLPAASTATGRAPSRSRCPRAPTPARSARCSRSAAWSTPSTFFQVNATVTGRRGKLRPGDYTLLKGMTNGAALDALVTGPKAKVVKTVNVTVPEGLSIREAAPIVDKGPLQRLLPQGRPQRPHAAQDPRRSARRAARAPPRASCSRPPTRCSPTPRPATSWTASSRRSARTWARSTSSYAKKKNLTRYDVLIIASMVEREAQLDRERPLVSAVIYNRLKDGMTLGIDATIRYYENNWARPLRVSELERDSPYNTRLNRGLPPTPIGNPGLASIKAAANPARGKDYLFYVRKPGDSRRARVLVHGRAVPARRGEVPGLARALIACPAGRLRLAGRPLALARMHEAALAALGLEGWRYLKLPLPPELFAETVRALPAAGFRGVNVTIPHKEAALALAERGERRRARDRRRQHAHVRAGRRHPGRQHRRARADRGARGGAGIRPAAAALVLGAGGAARAAVWALRARRRGRRGGLEPHARARARAGRAARRARRRAPGGGRDRRQLHVGRAGGCRCPVQGATPPGR